MDKWIVKAVDDAGALDSLIKAKSETLKVMKTEIKDYARLNKMPLMEGDSYSAIMMKSTENEVDTTRLVKAITASVPKADFISTFVSMFKPDMESIRSWLKVQNIIEADVIKTVSSDSYGRVSFKKRQKRVRKARK